MSAFELNRTMPSPASSFGGTIMGKALAHSSGISLEKIGVAASANRAMAARCGFRNCGERSAETTLDAVDHADAVAVDRVHGRQRAQLAQAPVRAGGQVHAGRVGAVDDIEVVIAGQHQHAAGERGMLRQSVEDLGPFGRQAGVGHVAGDQDGVERLLGVDRFELIEQAPQPVIAARARPAAFQAKAVALADHVDVGEMNDAPGARVLRQCGEFAERARLRHDGIGKAPDQGGDGEIGRDRGEAVGERYDGDLLSRS